RDWFGEFAWDPSPTPLSRALPVGTWALFGEGAVAEEVAQRLRGAGCRCVRVQAGNGYRELGSDLYRINPDEPGDYRRLVAALSGRAAPLRGAIPLGACAPMKGASLDALEQALGEGVLSAFLLGQALQAVSVAHASGSGVPPSPLELWLVGSARQPASGPVVAP